MPAAVYSRFRCSSVKLWVCTGTTTAGYSLPWLLCGEHQLVQLIEVVRHVPAVEPDQQFLLLGVDRADPADRCWSASPCPLPGTSTRTARPPGRSDCPQLRKPTHAGHVSGESSRMARMDSTGDDPGNRQALARPSPLAAAAIADRSDPGPLSAVLVTTAVLSIVRTSNASSTTRRHNLPRLRDAKAARGSRFLELARTDNERDMESSRER